MKRWLLVSFLIAPLILYCAWCETTSGDNDSSDDADEGTTEEGPEITPTGYDEGQVPYDFELKDQNCKTVTLYEWYGYVIIIDISEMWCPPCQEAAEDAEDFYQDFKDSGFIYISIICQDWNRMNATGCDIDEWVEMYGLTFPVLRDGGCHVTEDWMSIFPISQQGYPTFWIIDQEMVVYDIETGYSGNYRTLRNSVEELLEEQE